MHFVKEFNLGLSDGEKNILTKAVIESCNKDTAIQYFHDFGINNLDYSKMFSLAFRGGNAELAQYFYAQLESGPALFKDLLPNDVLTAFNDPQMKALCIKIIDTWQQPIKISKIFNWINLSSATVDVLNYLLDRGADFCIEDDTWLQKIYAYPTVKERYIKHIRENEGTFNFSQKLRSCASLYPEVVVMGLEAGFKFSYTAEMDEHERNMLKDDLLSILGKIKLQQPLMAALIRNSKNNIKPSAEEILSDLKGSRGSDPDLIQAIQQQLASKPKAESSSAFFSKQDSPESSRKQQVSSLALKKIP